MRTDFINFNLTLTNLCNLKCTYCGEEEGHSNMPKDITYSINSLKRFFKSCESFYITFYGGEPLIRSELIKEIMDELPADKFILQTNATLLDRLDINYLKKINIMLVSIDGNEYLTNLHRGKGTYQKIIKNLKWLKEEGYNGKIIARMTVSEDTKDIDKQVLWLLDNPDFSFSSVHWQMNVLFNKKEQDWNDFSYWAKNYYIPSLDRLFAKWIADLTIGKVRHIIPFEAITKTMISNKSSLLRCGAGWKVFTITTDGGVIPCPVTGMTKFALGNIYDNDANSFGLGRLSCMVDGPCPTCDINSLCGGRCLWSNLLTNWNSADYNTVCGLTRHLISQLLKYKSNILSLIDNGIIKHSDFNYDEYTGCEVIP